MTTARKRLVTTMMHFTTNQRKARDTHKYRDDTDNNVSGGDDGEYGDYDVCLLYTSPSPRDEESSRMPSSA